MKQMKFAESILFALLTVVLAAALCACGGTAAEETYDPSADASRCGEYIAAQDYSAVIALYEDRIAAGAPLNTDMKHWTGTAYMGLADYANAVRLFRSVLDEDPEYYYAPYYLGLCEYTQGHYTEAEEAFTMALEQVTEEARCYYYRGMSRLELSKKDEAILDFAMVLLLDEDPEVTADAVHMLELLEQDLG